MKNAENRRRIDKIKFSDEEKKRIMEEIRFFFQEERDEEIGFLATEKLYDFFIDELGQAIYNKALDDAKAWFGYNMNNLESDFYSLYKE